MIERNATLSLPFDLTKYNDYVYRGGVLSKEELEEWEWGEKEMEARQKEEK